MIRLIIIILNTFDFIFGIFVKTISFTAGTILELASTIFRGIDSLFDLFFFTMSLLGKGISLLGNVIYFLGNGIYTLANSFYILATAHLYTLLAGIALVGRYISYLIGLIIPVQYRVGAVSLLFGWGVLVFFIATSIYSKQVDPVKEAYSEIAFYQQKIYGLFEMYISQGNLFLKCRDPFFNYLGYKTETDMWKDFYLKELGIQKTAYEVDNPKFQIPYFKDQADFVKFLAKHEGFQNFLKVHPDLKENFEAMKYLANELKKASISADKAVDKYIERGLPRALKAIETKKQIEASWEKFMVAGTILVVVVCIAGGILEACNHF